MNGCFFGDPKSPLFGAYYPADAAQASDSAVLICPPVGQEYMRSHRALHQLAGQLAVRGFHVLRFDYTATGDSAGDEAAITMSRWRADIAVAARELMEVSGSVRIALLGLRLGAALACLAAETVGAVRLVLWDPVVSGAEFLGQLEALHRASLLDRDRFPVPRTAAAPEDEALLLGFHYPGALRRELQGLNLLDRSTAAGDVALIVSDELPSYAALRAHLEERGCRVAYRPLAPSSAWDRLDRIESVLMPYPALKTIVAALTESSH